MLEFGYLPYQNATSIQHGGGGPSDAVGVTPIELGLFHRHLRPLPIFYEVGLALSLGILT